MQSAALRLTGAWQVQPIPLEDTGLPGSLSFYSFEKARAVPECCHLQPALYPDNPYWGKHLRQINEQAWLFQRRFTLPGDLPFRRARLRFEGVDYFASVWLNGHHIGDHEGNFAPFTLDVTEHLYRHPDRENVLTVRVSAPWDQPNPGGSYPVDHVIRGLVKGLYEHGEGVLPPDVHPLGIWRPVWLLLDQGISVDSVRIRADLDGTISIECQTTNATGAPWHGTLGLEISPVNHAGQGAADACAIRLLPGQEVVNSTLHVADPHLWWPWDQGASDLYSLKVSLCDEQHDEPYSTLTKQFGIRQISLERSPKRFVYRINDRPVFVRGTSYIPAVYLSQCTSETFKRDLQLVRDLNLNLIRVHIHVSPPELYDLCDQVGLMVWQDFELNWMHDPSLEFEARARKLQQEMIDLLGDHPSIITWTCHNEPTMVYMRRANLERHPDPALYADACRQDPTRPVFISSGQLEHDWQRSGDTHSYYGALWTSDYTDIYRQRRASRLASEFGCEAPAAVSTLKQYPECWERLRHLEPVIDALGAYQAQLIQFHVEQFRRQRTTGCAGYIHFWLADLVPQVGWGILDAQRQPKGGYQALQLASTPLHIALEHDGRLPHGLWVFNDTCEAYAGALAICRVFDHAHRVCFVDRVNVDIAANHSQRIADTNWPLSAKACGCIELELLDHQGNRLAHNQYDTPFRPLRRPYGYPWKFDPFLGCKVFNRPDAPSLADQNSTRLVKLVPVAWRERIAEWALRQPLPPRLLPVITGIGYLLDI